MPAKKASLAATQSDGLVFLAYRGRMDRVVTHDDTGLQYAFNAQTPSWVPGDLANHLLKTEPRVFSLAQPTTVFETLGGA